MRQARLKIQARKVMWDSRPVGPCAEAPTYLRWWKSGHSWLRTRWIFDRRALAPALKGERSPVIHYAAPKGPLFHVTHLAEAASGSTLIALSVSQSVRT